MICRHTRLADLPHMMRTSYRLPHDIVGQPLRMFWCSPEGLSNPGSRAVAIPRQESSGGASAGRSAHSASSGPRAIASPFSQRASYVDDDDDEEPTIDPEDLWAPMGTPIPPATSAVPAQKHSCPCSAHRVQPVSCLDAASSGKGS